MHYDLVVIGGGINGCGIARDAAGRGLSVYLVEENDFASGTSGWSSKLIHGGLRYLEQYDFNLVRESLHERDVMLKIAPHIVGLSEFRMPWVTSGRSRWLVRLGIKLYDWLSCSTLVPKGGYIQGPVVNTQNPILKKQYQDLFYYGDCITKDTRLVIENAISAVNKGAILKNYTACTDVEHIHDGWRLKLHTRLPKEEEYEITAKMVINAAGPWIGNNKSYEFQTKFAQNYPLTMVKGSHIVVAKLYEGSHSYVLPHADGRIVFICPFENDYSLIGTTEEKFSEIPNKAQINEDERYYLLDTVNSFFEKELNINHIIWDFSGVRALAGGGKNVSHISRESIVDWQSYSDVWWCNIIGGKLTSYRKHAEKVVDQIAEKLQISAVPWTAEALLPGGDISSYKEMRQRYYWVPEKILKRWFENYGSRIGIMLQSCSQLSDLGKFIVPEMYERELRYACGHEMVRCGEDFLMRRSKLFLNYNHVQQNSIDRYINGYYSKAKS